jgi:hypothetical protein
VRVIIDFKNAVFTFNSQVDIQVFVFGNHPDQSFRFMGVETIQHDVPSGGFWIDNQRLRAMPDIFEFTTLNFSRGKR